MSIETLHRVILVISAVGALGSVATTAGLLILYKWKFDRMWRDYCKRHGINGTEDH